MNIPNLFIVGGGRSGTTSLHEWLKEHPEVFMSEVKGPNFFGEEPNPGFEEFFKNKKKYLSLFSKANNKKIIGESSHYFWSKTAAKEIKKFNPEAKVIIILRNPLDVAYSYYLNGNIPNNISFEDSIASNDLKVKKILDELKYHNHLKRFLDNFKKEIQLHLIIFDDLSKNQKAVYKKLCKFLDINNNFIPDFKPHNQARKIKNKWLLKTIHLTPNSLKLFVKRILPKKIVDDIKTKIGIFTTKNRLENPKVKRVNAKTAKIFNEEIKKTKKLTGLNLNKWLIK